MMFIERIFKYIEIDVEDFIPLSIELSASLVVVRMSYIIFMFYMVGAGFAFIKKVMSLI